ncbi:MAG TPA: glycoside hydrolase family 25 protein [Tepidisphaeraceae bacterium]|nr:glycoside hydrolase family 25 protein [Tepidisphaeraceae bacterium]
MGIVNSIGRGLAALVLVVVISAPAPALARDFGVDVSHHNGPSGVSQSAWNQMAAQGKTFAYIKASEGLTGPDDAAMASNVARATSAGIRNGVYHYAHPENRNTLTGAQAEADHLLSYAGSAIAPGKLRPVLDLEDLASGLSQADLTTWAINFSNRIIAVKGAAYEPLIYCNRSFARDELDSRIAGYDLWLANYDTPNNPASGEPPSAPGYEDPTGQFNNWMIWQYSETGTAGGVTPIDLNVFNNDDYSFNALIIPEPGSMTLLASAAAVAAARRRRHA